MRTQNRLEQLETRLRALEEAATDTAAIPQLVALLEQATALVETGRSDSLQRYAT